MAFSFQDVRQGNTAGHIAAMSGNHFALSQLDHAKIDWNMLNRKGETAYQLLTDRNMEWMAQKLKVGYEVEIHVLLHPVYVTPSESVPSVLVDRNRM